MSAAKQHILAEIKRLADASGGRPPGIRAFESQTGIKESEWFPHLWLRWSEAQKEAGYAPNAMVEARSEESLLESFARLAQRLGRFPIQGELIRESKASDSFPSEKGFRRFGGKAKLLSALAAFCRRHPGFEDVLALCEGAVAFKKADDKIREPRKSEVTTGFVYLMKSGPHYKIGRTNSLGRRAWELSIKIPVPPRTIHHVETDDPAGVEAYWHKRFEAKRGEGEWFSLSAEDVLAFKRWKRIV
jgi:hypothetical protein